MTPARRHVAALHDVGPERPGIVDIGVDLVAGEGAEDDGGAEPFLEPDPRTLGLDARGHQRGENVLLGEVLRAEHVVRAAAGRQRGGRGGGRGDERDDAGQDAATVAPRDARLDQAEHLVDEHRERNDRNAAGEHIDPVLGLQAGEDVVAEARLADGGAERRNADGPHCGGADARHDDRRRERQLDTGEALAGRHADAVGRLDVIVVDSVEAGDAVAQDRQHRIDRQRKERRQKAERRHGKAEDPHGQRGERQQQRIEQREQRKAGDGLREARRCECDEAQPRAA